MQEKKVRRQGRDLSCQDQSHSFFCLLGLCIHEEVIPCDIGAAGDIRLGKASKLLLCDETRNCRNFSLAKPASVPTRGTKSFSLCYRMMGLESVS